MKPPGGSPEDYVAAYRRVRGIFDDAGAKRVEWVWCPNVIVNGNADAISRSYPGDDFVDIVELQPFISRHSNERAAPRDQRQYSPRLAQRETTLK